MPPKVLSMGAKKGLPQMVTIGGGPKPLIPSIMSKDARKTESIDILADTEIQPTINSKEKNIIKAQATNEEDKLPRYEIDKVEFCIMNATILDKLKVVNVSSRINRDPVSAANLVK